ncbi:MAG: glycosyltransferase family 4 protein [Crocinitomicaceae bacterium]|nr:glycosyltransferase family 4 protein [Crocinitomicaceae bacterium]
MRIAINTRMLLPKMEGFGWYTYELAKRLAENHPEHEFYFFFDRPFDKKFIFSKNVTPVVLYPPARHPILFYLWFEWAVKWALKKHKIDLFFSPDGYVCLGTNTPQVATIHDLNFAHNKNDLPKVVLNYLDYYFPKFAQKATKIITVSNYSKEDIVNTYKIDPQKITVIWNGASPIYQPIEAEVQQKIRDKYTAGKDYFLFVGSIHPRKNLKRLIQAYNEFKRQTQSTTKLVIVGEALWRNESFNLLVDASIKSDVIFTGHLPLQELAFIMASAKLFTYIPYFEGFGIPLAEAMRCGTPILSGNLTSLPEVAGNAAEYCNPFDVDEIAKKMIELNSNPTRLTELATAGLERSTLFTWDNAAKQVAEVLGIN